MPKFTVTYTDPKAGLAEQTITASSRKAAYEIFKKSKYSNIYINNDSVITSIRDSNRLPCIIANLLLIIAGIGLLLAVIAFFSTIYTINTASIRPASLTYLAAFQAILNQTVICLLVASLGCALKLLTRLVIAQEKRSQP